MISSTLLTFGHGYSAEAFAASLQPDWQVFGTTRSAEKWVGLRQGGIVPVNWADRAAVLEAIGSASHVLVSAPPTDDGDPVLAAYGDALRAASPAWVGYLSTTGVYGDRQGGWVDETTPVQPLSDRGRRRVAAEQEWLDSGLPVHVFRLAGIYGPGRNALERLRSGQARRVFRPGQIFCRIHRDDIAQALRASSERPNPGRVYNLADDVPAPPQDVVEFAAELLGIEPPELVAFAEADLSPMALSFYRESKKVCNRRLKEELGVSLMYPGYKEGLRAIHAAES